MGRNFHSQNVASRTYNAGGESKVRHSFRSQNTQSNALLSLNSRKRWASPQPLVYVKDECLPQTLFSACPRRLRRTGAIKPHSSHAPSVPGFWFLNITLRQNEQNAADKCLMSEPGQGKCKLKRTPWPRKAASRPSKRPNSSRARGPPKQVWSRCHNGPQPRL